MSAKPYVGFSVGGIPVAVEASVVRAVEPARKLVRVPFSRTSLPGVVVREGRAVPVADLSLVPAVWNEVPPRAGDQVVVLGAGEIEAGLLAADAEAFILPAAPGPEGEEAPRPPAALREAILCGAVRAKGRTYALLRVEAALRAAGIPAAGG